MERAADRWQEIADRAFVRRYRLLDQSIGVILGPEGVLVVDTRSTHRQADELRRDIAVLTPLPVRAVVDTHHHYDHAFGNHVFRPAPIWGHVRCASRLLETAEAARAEVADRIPDWAQELAEVVIDPPDRTFEEHAVVDVIGRRVELRYLGRGHTDDDVVALVPDAGALFAGDLLENGAPPWFGDGFPLDWPETVSRLLDLVRGPVVPGHGEVADRRFVEDQLEALSQVAELSRRVYRGELGLEQAVAAGPFGPDATREPVERGLAQLRGELD